MCVALGLGSQLAAGQALAAGPAEATPIGIAPINYSGDLPSHMQSDIEAAVAEAIERIDRRAVFLDPECQTSRCGADVDHVLVLSVGVDERDYQIDVEVYSTRDDRQLAEASELCDMCGHSEVLETIEAQVTTLRAALERDEAAPQVRVEGSPPGATVILDGQQVGQAPLTAEVTPGVHELELRAPERNAQIYKWEATLGVEEVFVYELSEAQAQRRGGRGLSIAGWVSFGLGLAGVGAGVALVVIDGRDYGPTCSLEVRDVNGACPNIYKTARAGFVGLGLGGVALAAGTGLVIEARRKRKRQASAAVARLQPSLGGFTLQF
ncbi:PEGA domain protein [Enhygromyxa salina]|uniref:PEGA domain protein n=1 Tax=Enhygromyxa salina TaxID=215803 RepID=A0A2S9XUN7_9BACT|nr:PEGA domain-containing protein [Enhygromyxa salina]PRP96575.1 PEGA domain protein [Enhygromyxa salina]